MSSTKPSLAERLRTLSPKQKQYIMVIGSGVVFMGIVFGSMALWDSSPGMTPASGNNTDVETKNIMTPGAQVDPREVWMTQSGQQIREMENSLRALNQRLDEADRKIEGAKQQQQAQQPQDAIKALLPELPPMNAPMVGEQAIAPLPEPIAPDAAGGRTIQDLPPIPPVPQKPRITSFKISEAPQEQAEEQAQETQGAKTYIPSGSFMRVALLGGLDAPTGGQAQNNPWPVLMRVQDNAFLPNRFRARVKECFALGSGYGDLSTERANIRLESFSCVLNNGEVVDTAAKGYAVGEDGKAGLRGRLISKQGQVLANALMTGIIAGIGQGFRESSTTYTNNGFGSVGTIDKGKAFEAGVGEGVGKALDRMSQYYITLAEKMFPIIEIDAAREVDVVLTKGITLGLGSASDEGDYTEIWKRASRTLRQPLDRF